MYELLIQSRLSQQSSRVVASSLRILGSINDESFERIRRAALNAAHLILILRLHLCKRTHNKLSTSRSGNTNLSATHEELTSSQLPSRCCCRAAARNRQAGRLAACSPALRSRPADTSRSVPHPAAPNFKSGKGVTLRGERNVTHPSSMLCAA